MDNELLHFQVQGKWGPMTLTFRPLGQHPNCDPQFTANDVTILTQADVEEWYVKYNYPSGGNLATRRNRRYCGLFTMVN